MSIHNPKICNSNDNYMTPKSAWENIKQFIPPDKEIWESFYGDGKSGEYLSELGFNVVHKNVDFFENDYGDIVISNPPYSKIKEILKRLFTLDKPFILLMPSSRINTIYMREWKDKHLQIIIPKKRVQFEKLVDGKPVDGWKSATPFDCFYYCYKIGLPNDITWLD